MSRKLAVVAIAFSVGPLLADDSASWLVPQDWIRDTEGPVLSLGSSDAFDDRHVFAPCVVFEDGRYLMWYAGSRGSVSERVFRLGLATSRDGRAFEKRPEPVLELDGGRSVLTPTVLRDPGGAVRREDGRIQLWFSSTDFREGSKHTLHRASSADGVSWSNPSASLLEGVYAPTIIRESATGGSDVYRMWYTDVSTAPWTIRAATSRDGDDWSVVDGAVLKVDQDWERGRLFYPAVIKTDGVYLMWYGSYWRDESSKTALGLAVSRDGVSWTKSPRNPVLRPDPSRPWESHYTTSQSILRLDDGSWRIWYATRKKPPFVNKYFAIATARWAATSRQPELRAERLRTLGTEGGRGEFRRWQAREREALRRVLGIPDARVDLAAESRRELRLEGSKRRSDRLVVEKWVYSSEPGSRVPALVYRPDESGGGRRPGVVLTFGHGRSKSHVSYQYMAQTFARLGFIVVAADPIGEEERHVNGRMGTRAHDPESVHRRAWRAGRPIMGKLVFDTMRALDLLLSRGDVDPKRVGVAGNSLGGAVASWMAALDSRLAFAIVSGWALDDVTIPTKFCTRVPNEVMRRRLSWPEFASLAAPHCAMLLANGDADVIIDRDGDGSAWRGTDAVVNLSRAAWGAFGVADGIRSWYSAGGGHRPYPANREVLRWLLGRVRLDRARLEELDDLNFGQWVDRHGVKLERLYGTALHLRGATLADTGNVPVDPATLRVLSAAEAGRAEFTLDGWLR